MEAPDAEEVKNLSANSTGIKYIQSDTSESVTYFVRDDGYVDRTKGGGKIGTSLLGQESAEEPAEQGVREYQL